VPAIRVIFLLTGSILGVFYPFVSTFLAERDFTPAEVGFTIALSSLAFTVAVPAWGHVGDVVLGRVAAVRLAVVSSTIAIVGMLADVPPIAVALLIVVFTVFQSALTPLADALAVNALGGASRAYARIRLLSSFGFAGASVLAGRLYDETGFEPAPALWGALGIGILVATFWAPDVARFREPDATSRDVSAGRPIRHWGGSTGLVLRREPRLRRALLALGLVHVGILAAFTFLSLRLLDLGGQPSDVALGAGVKAIAEIPAFLVLPRIVARTGIRSLLMGGIASYALIMVLWAVIDQPALIIVSQTLNGVAYAAVVIAAVLTIAALLPAELQGTGQGLYQTVAYGIAAIVANAFGGVIYGSSGASALFLACAVLATIGVIVIWRTPQPGSERVATNPPGHRRREGADLVDRAEGSEAHPGR
jgi:MFS transporter, PPP family, 3-phenylpropionic acid transporter